MNVYSKPQSHTDTTTASSRLTVKLTLQFALQFVFREAREIACRVALPMVTGGLALYATLYLYLLEYERYLVLPNDRAASLILGVASAGALLTLFCHSVTTTAITSLALGREDHGWRYFCVSRRAWRTYAAYLRFLLVCVALVAATLAVRGLLRSVGGGALLGLGANLGMLIALAALAVRAGYLIAPVAAANDKGTVVREAWRLSSGHFWKLAATMFVIALPGVGVEAVCEAALRIGGFTPVMQPTAVLADFVAVYRTSLPAVLVAVGTAYVLGVVLMVAASAAAYRQIVKRKEL
jgi:hypothetical protein